MSDRKVRLALEQLEFWKRRRSEMLTRLGLDRPREQVRKTLFRDEYSVNRRLFTITTRAYKYKKDQWNNFNSSIKATWAKPLRESFVTLLDSHLSLQPPGLSPGWAVLKDRAEFIREYVEACSQYELEPSEDLWESWTTHNRDHTVVRKGAAGRKDWAVVAKAQGHRKRPSPSVQTRAKAKGKHGDMDHPPVSYFSGKRWYCSYCGREAPVFRLHGCFVDWNRKMRRRAAS
jgi:hypothetical protein